MILYLCRYIFWPISRSLNNLNNKLGTAIMLNQFFLRKYHCVKSVRSQSYSGSYFPAFGLNTKRETEYLFVFFEEKSKDWKLSPEPCMEMMCTTFFGFQNWLLNYCEVLVIKEKYGHTSQFCHLFGILAESITHSHILWLAKLGAFTAKVSTFNINENVSS